MGEIGTLPSVTNPRGRPDSIATPEGSERSRPRGLCQTHHPDCLRANSVQPPPGNPPIHDWKDVRGLFFTPCSPALQDTYFSLAALELLGGLNQIDREACIKGILKQHRGKGYFISPDSGGFNEYHIDGNARDTFAAFESLRILGALDRVKDLAIGSFGSNHGAHPNPMQPAFAPQHGRKSKHGFVSNGWSELFVNEKKILRRPFAPCWNCNCRQ